MEKLKLYNYFNSEELNKLHKKVSEIITVDRLEVDMTSEEIATKIIQAIFNKKE